MNKLITIILVIAFLAVLGWVGHNDHELEMRQAGQVQR